MYQIGTYFLYVYHSLSSFYMHKLDKSTRMVSGTNRFTEMHLLGKYALCDEQNCRKLLIAIYKFINCIIPSFTDICKIFTIYLVNLFANYKTLIYICIVTTTATKVAQNRTIKNYLICKTDL